MRYGAEWRTGRRREFVDTERCHKKWRDRSGVGTPRTAPNSAARLYRERSSYEHCTIPSPVMHWGHLAAPHLWTILVTREKRSQAQRDALSLIGLMDRPQVALQLLDCWTPGHLRDVVLALAAAIDPETPVGRVMPPDLTWRSSGRMHAPAAAPHRCDMPACRDLNRQWEAEYRRARRAAARVA
jgi:hypothetical protein